MNNRVVLSMHQPNFLPWIGYFDKMRKSDIFVVLDNVQIPRGKSIANRNFIKTSQGKQELVVPVKKPSGFEGKVTYDMVEVAEKKWLKKFLNTIRLNYKKAEYFDNYFSEISSIFSETNFCKMNIDFIKFVSSELDITSKITFLSDQQEDFGQKNELIKNLCKQYGANVYLSGEGARNYNDEEFLAKHNIQLEYQNFVSPEYNQLYNDFIPNLSVLDLLMNLGSKSKQVV